MQFSYTHTTLILYNSQNRDLSHNFAIIPYKILTKNTKHDH